MADTLHIVWSSGDIEVAQRMVFMYATNAKLKGWWKSVHVIIWGPSAKLVAENSLAQDGVHKMQQAGVDISACRRCAEMYSVVEKLEQFGDIEVIYMGEPFTNILKGPDRVITF